VIVCVHLVLVASHGQFVENSDGSNFKERERERIVCVREREREIRVDMYGWWLQFLYVYDKQNGCRKIAHFLPGCSCCCSSLSP